MKSVYPFLFACALALAASVSAQTGSTGFHPVAQVSLLNGSKGMSASVQATAGFRLKPLYLGLGTGIDYYRFRTVPLYVALRKDIGRSPAFLYSDIGYHFDWLTDANKNRNQFNSTGTYEGGLYYDIGIGARLDQKSQNGFILSAGYSAKHMKQEVQQYICGVVGPCSVYNETYRYNLGRIMIKAGWIF
jgi:hypothetical protein